MKAGVLTMEDVAREAGVSTYVVSMALRGRRGVAAATRERVEAVAERLGYRVSGAAAYLAQQQGGRGAKTFLVGYVLTGMRSDTLFLAACAERGWMGEVLHMAEWRTPEQAARQAWRRGVDGLLVGAGPFEEAEKRALLRFEWERFPAVKMSRMLPELALNLVRHSAFDYMMTTLEAVWTRGYRRLAVVMHESASARDDQARLGAILAFAHERAGEPGFTCRWRRVKQVERLGEPSFRDWLRENLTDAVVVDHWVLSSKLLECGLAGPGKTGLAAAMTIHADVLPGPKVSGCDLREMVRYRMALDILQTEMLAGRRGFTAHPLESVVEPEWIDGDTLPARRRQRAPRAKPTDARTNA